MTRTGGAASAVTVLYETWAIAGTAAAGEDYTAVAGTLTFGAAEAAKTFAVPILDDPTDEANETVVLRLDEPGRRRGARSAQPGHPDDHGRRSHRPDLPRRLRVGRHDGLVGDDSLIAVRRRTAPRADRRWSIRRGRAGASADMMPVIPPARQACFARRNLRVDTYFAAARFTATGVLDNSWSGDGKQTIAVDLGGVGHQWRALPG